VVKGHCGGRRLVRVLQVGCLEHLTGCRGNLWIRRRHLRIDRDCRLGRVVSPKRIWVRSIEILRGPNSIRRILRDSLHLESIKKMGV